MQVVDAIETGLPAARGDARRTRAHARARNHSTRVRALRRLIPVAAGLSLAAVAAAVFLNPFANLPAEVSMGPVSLSGTKVRMESPKLSGFRKGERGYEVTASAALQDVRKPTIVELEAMKGRIDTDDKGGVAHLEAASGLFDTARESLKLDRDIRLWTDKGEEVRLSSAAIDFKAGTVSSRETVAVSVPTGQVTADSLDVVDNGRVISFVGNVRTVFNGSPAAKGAAPAARILTSSAEPPDGGGRP